MVNVKTANVIAGILFLGLVGLLSYLGTLDWLPALILSLAVAIAARQLILGFPVDVLVTAVLGAALFATSFMHFFARVFLPLFFIIAALYFILRQFFTFKDTHADNHPKS